MGERTKIEWCDSTVNFVIGCSKVSPACEHCYAEALDARYQWGGQKHWGKSAPRYIRVPNAIEECFRFDRKAQKAGEIHRVFVNSLSDTFEDHEQLPIARASLFDCVAGCKNLNFLLLTKRPENVRTMVPVMWLDNWPANAWIGTTVEDQKRADERIPELLKIPAKVRFLSCEQLLENIRIRDALRCEVPIHWVIAGLESGPKRRWGAGLEGLRSLRDQCAGTQAKFFCKQIDKVQPIPADLMIREFPV